MIEEEVQYLRAHHIFCLNFLKTAFPERGPRFEERLCKFKEMVESTVPFKVRIQKGVDTICDVCLFNREDRCAHPEGDEKEVLKWDAIILKELSLQVGDVITGEDLRTILRESYPLNLCKRCKYKKMGVCGESDL